ncbi:MAG: glycosyltransferase family 4 protein [Spirulinaceae cyanobacterium SM2_1_0]|nr:glycosyltransferase family 4 protein [Spirulinaceae cyanobacterium SM2_1_0]
MHVAWLGKKSPFCGNVTYGREVTNALLERHYRVSFLHFAQTETDVRNWPDCPEVTLPYLYKSQVYTIPSLRSSRVFTEALHQFQPDLVHASLTLSTLDFRLPEICAALGVPLVATFHPPFDSKFRNLKSSTQFLTYQLYAPFLAHYDRVIVFSELQKDLLVRLGVPTTKVAVIPNGVDVQRYSPGASDFKQQVRAERLFVYLGRIATEKNVEAMLKAWKAANLSVKNKLVIVGDGPLAGALQSFYGAADGIIWHGFEGDEQQRIRILRAADVFVLPSLVEGLSLSLLEAMACGVACVATDAGADAEAIAGGAGIELDTQAVTRQLRLLFPLLSEHREWTALLGKKARQRVLERYTLSRNITQLEQLYAELVPLPPVRLSHRA